MAKKTASRAKGAALVVYRKAAPIVRRGASIAGKAAADEKHTIAAVLSALALGYAEQAGIDIPSIPGLGDAGTLGVGAFVIAKVSKSRTARHVATGLLSVAAYQLGKSGSISS